ncbi:MAG: hypothetical protein QG608_2911 [Actinomycetota bacterium]|nr:hypothetical protein [Actinomycetota bacterium]
MLGDLVRVVSARGYGAWRGEVERIGGCSHPRKFRGSTRWVDGAGRVVREFTSGSLPGGVLLAPCQNRRASRCPSCSRVYRGDVYHLVRAGLTGGKGVPDTVASHARVFVTLTAPSFGPVHAARSAGGRPVACRPRRAGARCPHGRSLGCWEVHDPGDPQVGAPVCRECFDYVGAVLWNAYLGKLWHRFVTYLPRALARATGRTHAALRAAVRLSYVKVVEWQARGLAHVHAVVRADRAPDLEAPGGGPGPAPGWVTPEALGRAVREAVDAVRVVVEAGSHGGRVLRWGGQVDVTTIPATEEPGSSEGERAARYLAKYATKDVTDPDLAGQDPGTPRGAHLARMAATARDLSALPGLGRIGRHARTLGYPGHVTSKSRAYSTTLTALRQARARHRTGPDPGPGVRRSSAWRLVGHGWSPGQALIAAEVARDAVINRAAARDAGGGAGAAPPGGRVGLRAVRGQAEVSGARSAPSCSSFRGSGAGR